MNHSSFALFCACILVFCFSSEAVASSHTAASSGARIELAVESDLRVLAEGFATAFSQMPADAKYLSVLRGEEVVVLGPVRTLRPHGGVVSFQIERGPVYVISAGSILQISTERPAGSN